MLDSTVVVESGGCRSHLSCYTVLSCFNPRTERYYKNLNNKVVLSVRMCALGSAKLPNGFEKFFLRLVDLNVDIVRKILDFYMR